MSSSIQVRVSSATQAGQLLVGELRLITTKPLDLSTLLLQFIGEESTCWYEPAVRNWVWSNRDVCKFSVPLTHSVCSCLHSYPTPSQLQFPQEGSVLVDHKKSHSLVEPGTYDYSFQWPIPADLPPSFKGSVGKIEYKLRASVTPQGVLSTLFPVTEQIPITLLAGAVQCDQTTCHSESMTPMDLVTPGDVSKTLTAPGAYTGSSSSTKKFFWFGKGGVLLRSQLSRSGYTAGDMIEGTLQVLPLSDYTSRTPKSITVSLVRRTVYHSPLLKLCFKKTKFCILHKQKMDTSALMANNQQNSPQTLFFQMALPPQLTPSFQTQLIHLEHYVQVHVDFGAFSMGVCLDMPCRLGVSSSPVASSSPASLPTLGGLEPKVFSAYLCDAAHSSEPRVIVSM